MDQPQSGTAIYIQRSSAWRVTSAVYICATAGLAAARWEAARDRACETGRLVCSSICRSEAVNYESRLETSEIQAVPLYALTAKPTQHHRPASES